MCWCLYFIFQVYFVLWLKVVYKNKWKKSKKCARAGSRTRAVIRLHKNMHLQYHSTWYMLISDYFDQNLPFRTYFLHNSDKKIITRCGSWTLNLSTQDWHSRPAPLFSLHIAAQNTLPYYMKYVLMPIFHIWSRFCAETESCIQKQVENIQKVCVSRESNPGRHEIT